MRGSWVAQLFKCLTWFWLRSWFHRFVGFSPASDSLLTARSLMGFSLSPSLSAPPLLMLALSLKINKYTLKKLALKFQVIYFHSLFHTVFSWNFRNVSNIHWFRKHITNQVNWYSGKCISITLSFFSTRFYFPSFIFIEIQLMSQL